MQTVYIISGPTASGKTEYAVKLARRLGSTSRRKVGIKSEIISADSRQVYKGMTIGSGAPPLKRGYWKGVRHHLIGVVEPTKSYTAFDFQRDANKLIEHIQKLGHTPIIVGGTGLWIRSLKEGLDFRGAKHDVKLRRRLEKELEKKGLLFLVRKLKRLHKNVIARSEATKQSLATRETTRSPRSLTVARDDKSFSFGSPDSVSQHGMTESFDYQNPRRVIRALEVLMAKSSPSTDSGNKYPLSEALAKSKGNNNLTFKTIHLSPSKKILYKRINKRVDEMVKRGLVKEVETLLKKYKIDKQITQRHCEESRCGIGTTRQSPSARETRLLRKARNDNIQINKSKLKRYPALTGIGYQEIIDYLQGKTTLREAVDLIKLHTRQYTKRQVTWFKKYR